MDSGLSREPEKLQRQMQKASDRENAKRQAAAPLFASVMDLTDADQQYTRWRKNKAVAGVSSSHYGAPAESLALLQERFLYRLAVACWGEEMAGKLSRYARKTYPTSEYWLSFWVELLTGRKRVALTLRVVEGDEAWLRKYPLSGGRRLVHEDWFPPEGSSAAFTSEELDRLLNPLAGMPYEELPSGLALWEEVQRRLRRS